MAWNVTTGAVVGALTGGLAYLLTGRHHMTAAGVRVGDRLER